jgi:DNA-binding NarL/FixJ family response regulator
MKIRELKIEVKVCILTNYSYPIYKLKCFETGADYFLNKAENFEDIKALVDNILPRSEILEVIKM